MLQVNHSKVKWVLQRFEDGIKFIIRAFLRALPFAIVILTIFASFNQIAQPLLGPRVDSFTITPLYIQSCCSPFSPDFGYFKVFKVSYTIEPPLFGEDTEITLRLPNSKYDGNMAPNPIDIITEFKQANPYSEILLEDGGQTKDKINVLIKPRGYDVKSLTVDLYFRQKLDDNSDVLSGYWWSKSTISPEFPVIQTFRNDVIGSFFYNTHYFEVHRIILQNKNNYEIRNLKLSIAGDQHKDFCYNENSPIPLEYQTFLMFDVVLPKERSSLLYFEDSKSPLIKTPNYNLTTLDCPTVMKMFS